MTKKRTQTARRFAPSWLTTERAVVGSTILLTLIVVVGVFVASYLNNLNRTRDIPGVQFVAVPAGQHREGPIQYPQTPPVGGPHNSVWQNCGVYDSPVPDENAVHSLEHGAVWITYQPDLPANQVDRLRQIARQSSHRLLSPYPGIDSPVIATVWGYQLRVDNADDPRLIEFILKYEEGPSTPELGAVCSGGNSLTLAQMGGG